MDPCLKVAYNGAIMVSKDSELGAHTIEDHGVYFADTAGENPAGFQMAAEVHFVCSSEYL